MKFLNWLIAVAASALLCACGGGGGSGGSSLYVATAAASSSGTSTSTTGGSTNVTTSTSGSVVMALSSTTISASNPGTVSALVKDASGNPIVGALVTFAVSNATATVSPTRVLTDATGTAATALVPGTGTVGADYVSASADLSSSAALTAKVAFTVSSVSVKLETLAVSPSTIPAYGASVLNISVKGASASSPVTVNFASTCASAGSAVISPASLVVTSTTATATYQDKGCSTTDRVSAVINGTSQQQQVDLSVLAPAAQSLEFVSASPSKICLAGSGCPASSIVSFKLKDQFGNAVAGKDVTFDLDIPNVATLSFPSAKTDSTGTAQVSVSAKTLPTPIRVRATVATNASNSLSTVSNVLSINAGLPSQRAFSFASAIYNVDGWSIDGATSSIRLQLNDRFANPVPDGTAISFVAEGASIIPGSCVTTNGLCTVQFVSSNFRPIDGRVSVIAYAQGEESFDDQDGDNKYSLAGDGKNFDDLGPVFIDKNENGAMDVGEYLVGSTKDGVWNGNTYVRASRLFILSDSSRFPRLFLASPDGACSTLPLTSLSFTMSDGSGPVCRVQQAFCMRDANVAADALGGNPVPAGATLSVSSKAKGAAVQVDGSPIGSTIFPTSHKVTVDIDDCSAKITSGGSVDLTVTMPGGNKFIYEIGDILK